MPRMAVHHRQSDVERGSWSADTSGCVPQSAVDGSTRSGSAACDSTPPDDAQAEVRTLRALLDGLDGGVALVGVDGTFRYTNATLERMYGYEPGELRGSLASQVFEAVPSGGPDGQQGAETGVSGGILHRRKDGSALRVRSPIHKRPLGALGTLWSVRAFDGERETTGVNPVCGSCQEGQHCNFRLPSAHFQQRPDGRGTLLKVCQGIEGLTGYPVGEFVDGQRSLQDLLEGGHGEALAIRPADDMPPGAMCRDSYRLRHRDGNKRHVVLYRRLLPGGPGQPGAIHGLLMDVTEVEQLEGQLRQARKMEAVGKLAGGIAHDFNTLLTAMLGWLEIAASELPAEHAAREALRMVERAARPAVGLSRSLLTFSHQSPALKQPILMNDLIRESARLLWRLMPAAIEQRVEVPPQEVWIDGDATQIQQVLMNLALNARDAMPGGGLLGMALETVAAAALPDDRRGEAFRHGAARLRIRDTGCGMADQLQTRVWEPFFTTKDRERGTGLGLSIVEAIVNDHQGWIDVESRVNRGSTFSVYLPRRPASESRVSEGDNGQLRAASPANVLVVEDHPLVRALLATSLSNAGYTVHEAADGQEGLNILQNLGHDLDVAIVDFDLPRVSGVRVLEAVRGHESEIAGIGITGYPVPASTEEHLTRLGCAILSKPFQIPNLLTLVASLLKRSGRSVERSHG